MMAQFWIGAAVLSIAALGFVVVPLWRQRQLTGGWSWLGSVAAALLVPSAVGLYLGIGTWEGQSTPGGGSLPPNERNWWPDSTPDCRSSRTIPPVGTCSDRAICR